jgi:hypothetical protein
VALGAGVVGVWCAGCGDNGDEPAAKVDARVVDAPERLERPERPEKPARPALDPPQCPSTVPDCERATGTIVYVERVDPDGDGDAHFVLTSESSITGPGITVVDVRPDLRPDPLPGPGDELAAAGPVQTGSYGQRQIEAVAVRTGR